MKSPFPLLFLLLAALPQMAGAQTAFSSRSPFLPPGANAAAGANPAAFELAGASLVGKNAQICLFDPATKHSRWLTVGKTENGIEVVSYDPVNDQAVVRFDGTTHTLGLRKASIGASPGSNPGVAYVPNAYNFPPPSGGPPNGPIVDPSIAGKTPEVVKQEKEARMLVSDLLEISIAQRKAYEDAQKKAAAQPHKGG